jgi:hypothetical protein
MNFLALPVLLYLVDSIAEIPYKAHYYPYGVPVQSKTPNLYLLINLHLCVIVKIYLVTNYYSVVYSCLTFITIFWRL